MDRRHFQVNHLFSSAANSFFGSRRNSATVGVGSSDVSDSNTMLNAFNKRQQQQLPTGVPRSVVDPLPFPAATNDYGNYYSGGEVMASRQDGDAETGSNAAMTGNSKDAESIKAKIIAHPQYPNLLEAYMDCQKIGAPPEVVDRLSAVSSEWERTHRPSADDQNISASDPELDQFMEAYYDMLVKYREELSRPLQEAMQFVRSVESQLNSLRDGSARGAFSIASDGIAEDEDKDEGVSGDDAELQEADPQAEETELKQRLLKKYSGYLGSLKQELSKKKKKGKLPKEARQKLLNWWELHYKWPYPSESEKVSLAESTGLDQKQINNWFINQRKRHWKPSDDLQFVVMDGHHPHHMNTAFFIDNHMMGDTSFRFGP